MKNVGCLYRVSSKRQVYKNDIPVQREACLKFIKTKENWQFAKEYIELGVSGYKVSTEKRDILQEIKRDVLNKKIDILLVFMFDRIGRKEEETPFVVEWLIKQKIEVWSVNEGQQKIENRTDKLINYITFWQAQGESEKISLRATESRIQLTRDGIYMGNYPPYGYMLIESDIVTKIGKKRRILKIFPAEAEIVRVIFELIVDYKYGIDKIAIYLNTHGYKRRKEGIKWDNQMVLEIARNPIYKGYVSFMKRTRRRDNYKRNKKDSWVIADKPNQDIIIISENKWDKANQILDENSRPGIRKERLLSGFTRCGYCKDYITPKGKNKYIYMICKGKKKIGKCTYNANYRLDRLEECVLKEIHNYLNTFKKVDLKNIIISRNDKIKTINKKISEIEKRISYINETINKLKDDVLTALMSNDENMQLEILNKLNKNKDLMEELEKEKEDLYENQNKINEELNTLKECIPNWSEEFFNAPLETKRKILKILINKIVLYNDKIVINIKYPISKLIIKGNEKNG